MKLFATRRIDEIGRILLPREVRKELQIESETDLDIFADDEKIVLRRPFPSCKICGAADDLTNIFGKSAFICAGCKRSIQEMEDSL